MGKSMKKVWLVTQGDYSDYLVVAAFTTKQLAEEAVATKMGEDYESRTLYSKLPKAITVLTIRCNIPTEKYPHQRHGYKRFWEEWEYTSAHYPEVDTKKPEKCKRVRSLDDQLVVEGTDFDRVRHAFGDYKAEIRAAWEWLT